MGAPAAPVGRDDRLAADFQDGKGPAARNPSGSVAEMRAYLAAGIDGFFTDNPGLRRLAADHA